MDFRAIIFVPALVGSVILGFIFLLFAAHYYLTVMESTGVGAKEVTWFSEPILDNAWKVAYLSWLVGLWLGPAYFIGRRMTAGMDSAWWKLAVPIAVFWLCYPISQLSSLSASTIWLPLTPDVFARLLQKPKATLGFFLLSIPVLAAFAVGFKWAFLTEGEWTLLFIGAPLMVVAGLMYARLIGRLAFALKFTKSLFQTKKKRKPKADVEASSAESGDDLNRDAEIVSEPYFRQPSELPPINTPDEGELTGYDVKFADDPPAPAQAPKPSASARPRKRVKAEAVDSEVDEDESPRPRRVRKSPESDRDRRRSDSDDDDDTTSYGVHEPEGEVAKEAPREPIRVMEEEIRLLRRDDAPKRPKRIWGPELLVFLGQEATIMAMVVASLFCTGAGVMVRIARMFNPADGPE
jgi:hypothetical protein